MDAVSGILLPLGLGLLGFIEPCSIGSSLLFLQAVEGRPAATKVMQAVVFTLTRAVVVGLLGAAAALAGTAFLGFQRAAWVALGALYLVLGLAYLTGNAGRFMRTLGPGLGRLSAARSAVGLAVLFGLNIPACAAPLLAAVLGSAAVGGPARVAQGFATLALFGVALSLPLTLALLWAPARRALDRLAALSGRVPVVLGLLLAGLGAWSIYLGSVAL
jgi:cytochrome c-type biogenesis protein